MHYEPFRKNFYIEHPEIKAMTEEEVRSPLRVFLLFSFLCFCGFYVLGFREEVRFLVGFLRFAVCGKLHLLIDRDLIKENGDFYSNMCGFFRFSFSLSLLSTGEGV